MGLDITSIDDYGSSIEEGRYGSYSRLHVLRRWVYEHIEGNSPESVAGFYDYSQVRGAERLRIEHCPALLNHSDCDGGYIDFDHFGVTGTSDPIEWADLGKLREEMNGLLPRRDNMPEDVREAFDDLRKFVISDDEEMPIHIVKFH